MSRTVMRNNIQNLITSLNLTIEKFHSIPGLNDKDGKDQIHKQIILLQLRLQSSEFYRIISTKKSNLDVLISNVQSERNNLRRSIACIELMISELNCQIDKSNSILSFEQKDIEALANSLDIEENPEEILQYINKKKAKVKELKEQIKSKTLQIQEQQQYISIYNTRISILDTKEAEYLKEISATPKVEVDENKRERDINKLNRFTIIENFLEKVEQLVLIRDELVSILRNLDTSCPDMNQVSKHVDCLNADMDKVYNELHYFVKGINVSELKTEKRIISDRIISKNGYVLTDSERELTYDVISSLQLSILADDNNAVFDDVTLSEYNQVMDKIKNEITVKETECDLIQKNINELEVKKNYFFEEYSQSQIDDINKEIRKKEKQLENLKRLIEKYLKGKFAVEEIVASIKKKKKNSDLLKESKKSDLRVIRELAFNRPTSKYSLNEDRQDLIYIDLIEHLFEFANHLLNQNYTKRLQDITLETIEPFVNVIYFYKYDHLDLIYSDEFVTRVRETIDKKLSQETLKPEDFIDDLSSQGITVVKYGKSLKTMEETKEMNKSVRLGHNG